MYTPTLYPALMLTMDKANINYASFYLSISCILTFTHVSVFVSWHVLLFICPIPVLNATFTSGHFLQVVAMCHSCGGLVYMQMQVFYNKPECITVIIK